jgi:hypothetical protein
MPERKSKPKKSSELSNKEMALLGIQYVNKKEAIKELDKQCKELRSPLESYLESSGKVTSTGSRLAILPYADVDVTLKHTCRESYQLLPEAADVLKELGFSECIELVPVIREDKIDVLVEAGKISPEDLARIYVPKTSYAFSVDIKERFDEKGID